MDINNRFIRLLKRVKRQLFMERAAKQIQLALLYCGCLSAVLALAARLTPIVYLEYYAAGAMFMFLLTALYSLWKEKPDSREAASLYDSYAGEDRVATALSFLDKKEAIYELQRKEALARMMKVEESVQLRKRTFIRPLILAAAILAWSISAVSLMNPNGNMETAEKKEKEMELVKKTGQKIKRLSDKEKLDRAKKTLQEMGSDLQKAETSQELLKELAKKDRQLELKKLQANEAKATMEQTIENLRSSGLDSLADALAKQDGKAVEQDLKQQDDKQRNKLESLVNEGRHLSESDLSALAQEWTNAMKAEETVQGMAAAQDKLRQVSRELMKDMEKLGIRPGTKVAQNRTSSDGRQNGDGKGADPQNGRQAGQSNDSGHGQGNGSKAGSSAQRRNGSGSDTSSRADSEGGGAGTGKGMGPAGNGAGKDMGSRELTIPEKLAGKSNVEHDRGTLGSGAPSEQMDADGPILRGNVRPYEEVYGQYEKAYRESSSRMQLPMELESIVKQYFSRINPDRE
ncbi:MAG TPA: hypothetical protein VIG80_07910 [Bacillaceae bacterium]